MRILILIVAIVFLFFGCNRRENISSRTEFVDTTIVVRFGQQVGIPNTILSLKFDRYMYEGRLPSGVQVPFWSNTAQLGMTVMPTGQKMRLYISGEIVDSTGVSFYGSPVHLGDLIYQMKTLEPLPVDVLHQVPDSELVAEIRVSKSTMVTRPDSPIFPAWVGNRWIYADTTFRHDTAIATSIDTITIADNYADSYGEWWVLSGWLRPFYGGELMVSADSAFTRESGEYFPSPGEPLSYASMELRPPSGDSSRYSLIYEGDMACERIVKRLDSAIVTVCGTFNGTWQYRAGVPSDEFMETQILKPGLGFVFLEFDVNIVYPYGIPPTTQRMWLTQYQINKE